jgi:hypothetical protein
MTDPSPAPQPRRPLHKNWKTYVAAAAAIVVGGLYQQGYIDQPTMQAIADAVQRVFGGQ